jgi:chromate reductase
MTKLLFLAASIRKGSYNEKLLKNAVSIAQSLNKATVTHITLKDFEMPLYNGDLEEQSGLPETAKKLKKLFIEHQGIFIASPEYNSSMPPLLKNSLDWISRKSTKEEQDLIAFKDKIFALSSASPGALGGMRGLVPLRLMLGNIQALVLPNQLSISTANQAFDDHDQLKDPKQKEKLTQLVQQLIDTSFKQTQ